MTGRAIFWQAQPAGGTQSPLVYTHTGHGMVQSSAVKPSSQVHVPSCSSGAPAASATGSMPHAPRANPPRAHGHGTVQQGLTLVHFSTQP